MGAKMEVLANSDTSFLRAVVDLGLRSSAARLHYELGRFFNGVSLYGKSVLDIGGGDGIFSVGAASLGAARVVCLEPLSDGSTDTARDSFNKLRQSVPGPFDIELQWLTFQEFHSSEHFDVIFLHDSINHLDEKACVRLRSDEKALATYQALARKLYDLTNPGGYLIVCDCSNRNLFGDMGVTNPFARPIEWNKHQAPMTWIQLFKSAGYSDPIVNWTSFNTLRTPGRLLLGNPAAAYLTLSHFRLMMRKGASE
jgi:SAM-dependent methyltransferase